MSDFNVPGSRHNKNTMKFRKSTVVQDPVTARFQEYLSTQSLVLRVYGKDAERPISLLTLPLLALLDSSFPGNPLWAWEFHPLIEIVIESKPLKSIMSVGRLGRQLLIQSHCIPISSSLNYCIQSCPVSTTTDPTANSYSCRDSKEASLSGRMPLPLGRQYTYIYIYIYRCTYMHNICIYACI